MYVPDAKLDQITEFCEVPTTSFWKQTECVAIARRAKSKHMRTTNTFSFNVQQISQLTKLNINNYAFHKGEMLRGIYHYYHKSNKNKFGFEKQAVVVNVQGFLLSLHISYLPCSQPEPLLVLVFFQFVSLIIAFFIILYFFLK